MYAINMCLDNSYARFGKEVFHLTGIPMRTNCAPLFAYLFLHCYSSQVTRAKLDIYLCITITVLILQLVDYYFLKVSSDY